VARNFAPAIGIGDGKLSVQRNFHNNNFRHLHLEDNDNDSELVAHALEHSGVAPEITVARGRDDFSPLSRASRST